jgi:hypothetical protein
MDISAEMKKASNFISKRWPFMDISAEMKKASNGFAIRAFYFQ